MAGECCICIGALAEPQAPGDRPVATKCGHLFHQSCLATWLKQKPACPSCKEVVRKGGYFRIFLGDAEVAADGTAEEPVDVDGDGGVSVAARRARADGRRYALLEEEVVSTRKALDLARSKAEEAEQKAADRQEKLNEQRRVMQEQDMVHRHDRDEAENWRRKYDRLHSEHVKLSDQAEKWRVIHDQRAKAEKIANEDADFDPAIDRPEVLKWANKQLVSTKAELKRQLLELRTENERLEKVADVAKKRLERHKERDRERRAKDKQRSGTRREHVQSGSSKDAAEGERAAGVSAASVQDLVAPLADLLPPRRESSNHASDLPKGRRMVQQPVVAATVQRTALSQTRLAELDPGAAAGDEAETSATFEPPASPELANDDGGCSAAGVQGGNVVCENKSESGKRSEEPRNPKDEDTAWAAALLEEEGGWTPSPGQGPVAVDNKLSVHDHGASEPVLESTAMVRTGTLVEQTKPRQAQQQPQQRRRPQGPAFGFTGAATAPEARVSAGGPTRVQLPSHPVNRPVPAEFRSWTATSGSKRGRQVVAPAGGGGVKPSGKGSSSAPKNVKRMKLLASGRGHTPKVSSFFK